jgi:hypothetical protein
MAVVPPNAAARVPVSKWQDQHAGRVDDLAGRGGRNGGRNVADTLVFNRNVGAPGVEIRYERAVANQ